MDKDKILKISFTPRGLPNESNLPHRICISINIAVFMLNLLERKFQEIEQLLNSHHAEKSIDVESTGEHKMIIDWGSERGDVLVDLVWSIVDWSEKLRKLLSSIAGIKKNEDWYKGLVNSLGVTKSIRNTMQHFDRELDSFINDSTPLMGAISAQFPLEKGKITYVISSSTFKTPYKDHINIYGVDGTVSASTSVDKITFSISKKSLNLTEFIANVRYSVEFMKEYLSTHYKYEWPKSLYKVHNMDEEIKA